jgi:hypothetical protein
MYVYREADGHDTKKAVHTKRFPAHFIYFPHPSRRRLEPGTRLPIPNLPKSGFTPIPSKDQQSCSHALVLSSSAEKPNPNLVFPPRAAHRLGESQLSLSTNMIMSPHSSASGPRFQISLLLTLPSFLRLAERWLYPKEGEKNKEPSYGFMKCR